MLDALPQFGNSPCPRAILLGSYNMRQVSLTQVGALDTLMHQYMICMSERKELCPYICHIYRVTDLKISILPFLILLICSFIIKLTPTYVFPINPYTKNPLIKLERIHLVSVDASASVCAYKKQNVNDAMETQQQSNL